MNRKLLAILVLVSFVTISCSSTSETTSTNSSSASNSKFPGWYSNSEFSSDSLTFFGFATAIAADSSTASYRAEAQAKANLEVNIGEITEQIRTQLVENGSSSAANTDFIIILRTAHSLVQDEAVGRQESVTQSENNYRAFSSVSISKEEVRKTLERGFTGHPRYWGEFSGSEAYQRLLN